jgi:hypothetical protein
MTPYQLKPIDPEATPRALEKAERYRLLNEPEEAESICLDVLAVEPENQRALVTLLLALTDQFHHDCGRCFARARDLLSHLRDPYERCYFAGIICERRASAQLDSRDLGGSAAAYQWLEEAMSWYEKAEAVRPPQNDDALLRWNTCVRIMEKHDLHPAAVEAYEPVMLE